MTWTQNTTTKVWTNSGAGRSVVIASTALPTASGLRLSCTAPAGNVKAIIFSSYDGRSCYEAGIEGANVLIRRVAFGTAGANVTNGASDTPASAACTTAHGLPAGVPFVLEVRVSGGTVRVYLNGTLALQHTPDATDYLCVFNPYSNQVYYGFASSTSGAVISKAEIAPLVLSEPTPMTEVLVAVCDGNIVISEDGLNASVVQVGAFRTDGLVSLAEYQRKVYGVDGKFAKVFDPDPAVFTVNDWTASAGSFPGSSGNGLTRMTMVENFLDRLGLAGDATDPQNAFFCAVGDATDWDTSADTDGRAFGLGTGLTGRIGQPITCLKQAANGTMVIGCLNQMWRLVGDPALGTPSLTPVSLGSGISGKDAATLATNSVLVAHSPDGAFTIGSAPGEPATPLSQATLRTGIEINRADLQDYYVIVVRDTTRRLTYFFLTPKESGTTVHYVYDEVTGQFTPGNGGWFEDQYSDSIGPTAACMFRGQLVIGTRDGRLLIYDEDTKGTDDDLAFTSNVTLSMPTAAGANTETILRRCMTVLGNESDPVTLRCYRGRNHEEALIGDDRSLAWSRSVSPFACEVMNTARSPALSLELWNTTADRAFTLEAVQVWYETGRRAVRSGFQSKTPRQPCPVPTDAGGDSTDSGPGGGTVYGPPPEVEPLFASQTAYEGDSLDPNLVLVSPPNTELTFDLIGNDSPGDEGVGEVIDEF